MKRFMVIIRFEKIEKCPTFEAVFNAENEDLAIYGAKQLARKSGFNGTIKTVAVKEVQKDLTS